MVVIRRRKDCMKKKPGRPKLKKTRKYKRKIGRRKKPGPKKKKNPVGRPKKVTPTKKRGRPKKITQEEKKPKSKKRPYQIILTSRKKRIQIVKTFRTEDDAYKYYHNMIEDNKNVQFPIRFLNYKKIVPSDYEIYIIKRRDNDDIEPITKLRDEYGELIEHETDNESWMIIDKHSWDIEESFWVFGYEPLNQRKNFSWIFNDFIENNFNDKYHFKNVLVYQNKFIVDCLGELKIVFCKNKSDALRMYDMVEKLCQEKKYKYVLFSGDIQTYSKTFVTQWIDKLCEFTSFNRKKIKRNSLRP